MTTVHTPLVELMSLRTKTAVVTGGGKGMGFGVARRLAEAGATVIIADIDLDAAAAVASELVESGGSAIAIKADVSQPNDICSLADFAIAQTGRLDIWVNNAGVYPMIPMFEDSLEQWERTIDINLRGVFIGTREAARRMIDLGSGGVVVNIASIGADRAVHPSLSHYTASKAGVKALTRTMGAALGRFGVRVVGLSPGVIVTDGMITNTSNLAETGVEVTDRAIVIPLGRSGTPDDIGRVVLFLASDLAAFVTGATIDVDGGDAAGARTEPITSLEVLGLK